MVGNLHFENSGFVSSDNGSGAFVQVWRGELRPDFASEIRGMSSFTGVAGHDDGPTRACRGLKHGGDGRCLNIGMIHGSYDDARAGSRLRQSLQAQAQRGNRSPLRVADLQALDTGDGTKGTGTGGLMDADDRKDPGQTALLQRRCDMSGKGLSVGYGGRLWFTQSGRLARGENQPRDRGAVDAMARLLARGLSQNSHQSHRGKSGSKGSTPRQISSTMDGSIGVVTQLPRRQASSTSHSQPSRSSTLHWLGVQ